MKTILVVLALVATSHSALATVWWPGQPPPLIYGPDWETKQQPRLQLPPRPKPSLPDNCKHPCGPRKTA